MQRLLSAQLMLETTIIRVPLQHTFCGCLQVARAVIGAVGSVVGVSPEDISTTDLVVKPEYEILGHGGCETCQKNFTGRDVNCWQDECSCTTAAGNLP